MIESYFAHNNTTRKYLVAFMDLFDEVQIEKYRSDASTSLISVPVQFANREKFFNVIRSASAIAIHNDEPGGADPITGNHIELGSILPRISVNLVGMSYDSVRHVNKKNRILSQTVSNEDLAHRESVNTPSPWNLDLELAVIAKTIDDGFQIMEQIIPFFQPSRSVNVKILEGYKSESVPIILNSVQPNIEEEIALEDERIFTILFTFTLKGNYYMPKKVSKKVTKVEFNLITVDSSDDSYNQFMKYVQTAENLEPIEENIIDESVTIAITDGIIEGN